MSEHSCVHEEPASEAARALVACRELLGRARSLVHTDAAGSLAAAHAALAAARTLPRRQAGRRDLVAEAWAAIANAQRLAEDYPAAARAWRKVHGSWRLTAENRPLGARLLRLEAAYFRGLREFEAAHQRLRRAIKLCQLSGDRHQEGQVRLARSRLFEVEGAKPEALRELLAALPLLDPAEDCDATFLAFHCAAGFLAELNRPRQAKVLLATIEPYYRLFGGELLQLRACWLTGKVLAALGCWREAEEHLERARAGFLAQGLPYDASLAGLELALAWLAQGKPWQVRELAREMFEVFSAKDIPREASAALLLFAHAARAGTLTLEQARHFAERASAARCERPT